MSTVTRVLTNPVGMARLVTNYSRIKEMESKGSVPAEGEMTP